MLFNRTNSYIFALCAVKRGLISLKYFKTDITHMYILLSDADSSFWTPYTCLFFQERHIQNPFKHLRWSVFACPVNNFKPLTDCAKTLNLRCLKSFEYTCTHIACNNVLCHHNKCMIEYFEFLYGSGVICLPLDIPKRITLTTSLEKDRRGRPIALILDNTMQYPHILKNNICHSKKWVPPLNFHFDTNPVFGYILIHSFGKIHVLVVTVELIWLLLWNAFSFNFVPMSNRFPLGWQDSEEAM